MTIEPPRRLVAVNHPGLHSGAETVLVRMLTAAAESGWDVTCCAPAGPLSDRLAKASVPTVALPQLKPRATARVPGLARLGLDELRAAPRIRRASAGAHVVLVNGLMALPAVVLARPSAPVCWYVHDVVVRRDLRAVARFAARSVDHAIAPSGPASTFPRSLGIDVTVSANGTSIPAHRSGARRHSRVVGMSAALTEWKGHHILLEAMAMVPDAELELMGPTFPGDADHADALERRAQRADLEGRVRFLGPVDDPEERMRRWDVCVSASIAPEAGSLVLLEAMALGLPIVATDHGCAAEYLGSAGELVPPGDPEALAAAISALLTDPPRAAQLGEAARARAERHFTIEQSQERFLWTIAALADERSS